MKMPARTDHRAAASLLEQLKQHHRETWRHSNRVALVAQQLIGFVGIDGTAADDLLWAARLHDVGKICIPERILGKPGPLDDAEKDEMRTHPEWGAFMMQGLPGPLFAQACQAAMSHHERWDGKGYPLGLRGEETPLVARLVALADCYEALRAARSYKPGWTHVEALEFIVAGAGKHFDPELATAFADNGRYVERHWELAHQTLPEVTCSSKEPPSPGRVAEPTTEPEPVRGPGISR